MFFPCSVPDSVEGSLFSNITHHHSNQITKCQGSCYNVSSFSPFYPTCHCLISSFWIKCKWGWISIPSVYIEPGKLKASPVLQLWTHCLVLCVGEAGQGVLLPCTHAVTVLSRVGTVQAQGGASWTLLPLFPWCLILRLLLALPASVSPSFHARPQCDMQLSTHAALCLGLPQAFLQTANTLTSVSQRTQSDRCKHCSTLLSSVFLVPWKSNAH